jgi:type II secretory pathway pseudopilin PulG
MIFLKKQLGFTLTEVLVIIVIFGFVVGAVYSGYILSQRSYREVEKLAEITQNGRVILERIIREIRQAREMVTELSPSESEATSILEFEDGHTPVPTRYQELGSQYYYIRYYIPTGTKNLNRQYIVYCSDECDFTNCQPASETCTNVCSNYYRWNAPLVHPCILEDRSIGEYVKELKFWGFTTISLSLTLEKGGKEIKLRTKILGRNL